MKNIKYLVMVVLMASALAACGMNNDNKDNGDDNQATENGVTEDNGQNKDNANNDNNDGVDNGVDHNGESRLDVAEDAADEVAGLDEVDNATVILTDNNAYVAVEMSNAADANTDASGDGALSEDLEGKIADKVREVKTDVDNVYVSLNPDFVERMRDYRTRIDEGEPIEGFFDEFGEAMRNVFPNAG